MRIEAPVRAVREATQHYAHPPERVFPMLCPVREADWVEGWDPDVVWTGSGRVEAGCVWIMDSGDGSAIWTTVEHDPATWRVRFVKVVPEITSCDIAIRLESDDAGGCHAQLRYVHTALGPRGRELVTHFTASHFAEFSTSWQRALANYLDSTNQ